MCIRVAHNSDMAEDTKVRDELARDRTAMANERTLLAYGRTSLGLIGLAVFIFKFTSIEFGMIFGSLSLTAAGLVFFWGIRSYRVAHAHIDAIVKSQEPAPVFVEAD